MIRPETILQVVGLALLGAYLLIVGIWPRRRGDTLRCRRCEYDISDQPRERCPECGTTLVARTMVRGTRTRVVWKIWAGVAVTLLVGAPMGPTALERYRQGRYDRYRPLVPLLRQAVGTDDTRAAHAFGEIQRRLLQRELSPAEVSTLVEFCLAQEAQTHMPRCAVEVRGLLLSLGDLGAFSPTQVGQVFDAVWDTRLQVAPVTELGGATTVWLVGEPRRWVLRTSPTPIVANIRCTQVTLDGEQVSPVTLPTFELWLNRYAEGACDVVVDRPGEHEIRVSWVAEISAVPIKDNANRQFPSTPATACEYSAVVRTQVVDRDAYDAEVAGRFSNCVEFKELYEQTAGEWVPTAEVVQPLPLPVELVIYIDLPGQQVGLGNWSLREGFTGPLSVAPSPIRWQLPGKIDGLIKLKSTMPLSDGETIERSYSFKGIPVIHSPQAKAPR